MEHWLEFAKGPLFRFTFLLTVLGMARLLIMQLWNVYDARRRAGDKAFPTKNVVRLTVDWLIPISRATKLKPVQGVASVVFHIGMLLIPLFFIEHVALWKKGVGFSWFGFSKAMADPLTLVTLIAIAVLFGFRLWDRNARFISRGFDYGVLVMLFFVFLSGFFASHPSLTPIPYTMVALLHILSAEAILLLIPFTKLAHVALYSVVRVSSEIGWKFVPDAGEKVKAALGKEGRV
jgi:nitrate reductase gamma subunit